MEKENRPPSEEEEKEERFSERVQETDDIQDLKSFELSPEFQNDTSANISTTNHKQDEETIDYKQLSEEIKCKEELASDPLKLNQFFLDTNSKAIVALKREHHEEAVEILLKAISFLEVKHSLNW
jgi:hypothetical protein